MLTSIHTIKSSLKFVTPLRSVPIITLLQYGDRKGTSTSMLIQPLYYKSSPQTEGFLPTVPTSPKGDDEKKKAKSSRSYASSLTHIRMLTLIDSMS